MIANLVPMLDPNPFHWLGDQVKESLADTFTSMMMALWSAAYCTAARADACCPRRACASSRFK